MEAIPLHLSPRPARFVLALLTTSASLAVAAPVQAGTYMQYTCRLPDGGIAATDGWARGMAQAGFEQENYCPNAGVMYTRMISAGIKSDSSRSWIWQAAPNTTLESVRLMRALRLAPGGPDATPVEEIYSGLDASRATAPGLRWATVYRSLAA